MVKLHEIYIIMKKRGLPAFHAQFRHAERLHPDLVSGLLTAISHFAKELRPDEKKDINLIKREDFSIMIEDGNKTYGAVIADFDDKDTRTILKRVVNAFEEEFDKELDDFGVNTIVFEKFKDVVVKEFGALLINPFYFPHLLETDQELPDDPLLKKIVNLIDGNKNLNEIALTLSISVEEVCQNISLLESRKFVEIKIKIEESDIFSPTEKATEAFSRETKAHKKIIDLFGDAGIDLLYSLDGKKDLRDIMAELQIPFNKLIKIINYFLTEEFISWVELYPVMRQLSIENLVNLTSNKEDQALAFTLRNMCDGTYALSTIARKLNLSKSEIKQFLKVFGNNIRWIERKL
ncbi:MAG: hypothetical protein HWN66_15890 [Candidatus Helarchaeota archaeon]|nr:hypothetical protein [Candidatus Helarchaeota archaeon]